MGKETTVCCVTGASGYVASHLVQLLLAKGYTVKGTVRNPDDTKKVAFLKAFPGSERLSLYKADLLDDGSFDEAIAGCQIVFHTASPFITTVADPQRDLIDPAVNGTKNVLASVNKTLSVKKVIVTSSVAAIYHAANDRGVGHVFTEDDWNERSNLSHNYYNLSKTLAERAAWEVAEKQDRWEMVVINPGLVFGPTLSGRDDAQSIDIMKKIVNGTMAPGAPHIIFCIVDVRDVAKAHILAAESSSAKGRYICISDHASFLQLADPLRTKGVPGLPSRYAPTWLLYILGPILGSLTWHFIYNNVGLPLNFSNDKIKKDLGMDFITTDKMVVDMYDSLVEHHIYTPPPPPLTASSPSVSSSSAGGSSSSPGGKSGGPPPPPLSPGKRIKSLLSSKTSSPRTSSSPASAPVEGEQADGLPPPSSSSLSPVKRLKSLLSPQKASSSSPPGKSSPAASGEGGAKAEK